MTEQEKPKEAPPIKIKIEETKKSQEQRLQELKLSWAGKLFFAGAAAYIGSQAVKGYKAGKIPKLPIKMKGTPQQVKAVMDALAGSAEFQRMVNKPGVSIEQVIDQLKKKNINKQNFEKIFKVKWPL